MKKNKEFVFNFVIKAPTALYELNNFAKDKEFILKAGKLNRVVFQCADESLKNDKDIIKAENIKIADEKANDLSIELIKDLVEQSRKYRSQYTWFLKPAYYTHPALKFEEYLQLFLKGSNQKCSVLQTMVTVCALMNYLAEQKDKYYLPMLKETLLKHKIKMKENIEDAFPDQIALGKSFFSEQQLQGSNAKLGDSAKFADQVENIYSDISNDKEISLENKVIL